MISRRGTCDRCTHRGDIYLTGKRWICRGCWLLLFRNPPEAT